MTGLVPDGLARLDVVKDTLTVQRVFGDAYEIDGTTVIPVAKVRGGGGGGAGQGTTAGDDAGVSGSGVSGSGISGSGVSGSGGSGSGFGFGVEARPLGVFVVRDGEVSWQPTIDVMRIVVGGQLLALAGILVVGHLLRRRR